MAKISTIFHIFLLMRKAKGILERNDLCGNPRMTAANISRWINMETQKFSTLGSWECLWDSQHRYLSPKSPDCRADTWWSSIFQTRKAPGRKTAEFDRNRHNFFLWQQARFSRSHFSPHCGLGRGSVVGDFHIYQIYTKTPWEPVEIPCLKCNRDEIQKGLGQKFYTGGVIRDIFKSPEEIFKEFREVHHYQTLLASKSKDLRKFTRSAGMGEQLESGKLLLTGGLYPTFGTYFCAPRGGRIPDTFVNVDTLVTSDDLMGNQIDPITGTKVISVKNEADWRRQRQNLSILNVLNDKFQPVKSYEANLELKIFWHPWSCCSGCVFNPISNRRQIPYKRRVGYLVVKKILPNYPVNITEFGRLDNYLSIRPYNNEGIPISSTLLWAFPTDRSLIYNHFKYLRNTKSPLGYYFEIANCTAVTDKTLQKCYKETAKCWGADETRMSNKLTSSLRTTAPAPVTIPATTHYRFYPDKGEGHEKVSLNYMGPAAIHILRGKSYLIKCDWGSNVFRTGRIRWRKGERNIADFRWDRANSEQQQYQVEGGIMHIHNVQRHHEGKYSCGKGEIHRLHIQLVYQSDMWSYLKWSWVVAGGVSIVFSIWLFFHIFYADLPDDNETIKTKTNQTEEDDEEVEEEADEDNVDENS